MIWALALLFASSLSSLLASDSPPRFPWRTDFAAARQDAAALGKPMLIVFRCEP